ncbi:MAG: sigma 54-interacting transcriptional regulator [Myxococcota bacterium]
MQRLQSLVEVCHALMAAADRDEVLERILEAGRRLLSAEDCSMALLEPERGTLVFFAMAGSSNLDEFRIPADRGFAGWVLANGKGVISNDAPSDPRFLAEVDLRTGYRTRRIAAAPVVHQGSIIGVIEALNCSMPQGFRTTDLELLGALGGLAATAMDRVRSERTVRNAETAYREDLHDRFHLVTGRSPGMRDALAISRRVARTRSTVLLLGESGTGKEVLARAIHRWSARAQAPFVAVNCVALSPTLLESELFGHERGAFTGATSMKPGRFELAEGGTIFLDEIGDLPPSLQTRLLRVLQEREFQRVGGTRDLRADVRVIAATNRDLRRDMEAGRFREDLYYRLAVVTVSLPSLTERREDIPELARHFVRRSSRDVGRPELRIDDDAMAHLQRHPWPGNARELSNVIERAVVLAQGTEIGNADLPRELVLAPDRPPTGASSASHPCGVEDDLPLADAVREFKRLRILAALDRTGGNQRKAAALLGVAESNLSRTMKTLGLRTDDEG